MDCQKKLQEPTATNGYEDLSEILLQLMIYERPKIDYKLREP